MAIAVKLFVIEAMRKTVSGVTGAAASTSRNPVVFSHARPPSATIPIAAPGMCCFSTNVVKSFSICGAAAVIFASGAACAEAATSRRPTIS